MCRKSGGAGWRRSAGTSCSSWKWLDELNHLSPRHPPMVLLPGQTLAAQNESGEGVGVDSPGLPPTPGADVDRVQPARRDVGADDAGRHIELVGSLFDGEMFHCCSSARTRGR